MGSEDFSLGKIAGPDGILASAGGKNAGSATGRRVAHGHTSPKLADGSLRWFRKAAKEKRELLNFELKPESVDENRAGGFQVGSCDEMVNALELLTGAKALNR